MPTYTINVSGSERHDGEKPYTYALDAESLQAAKYAAWSWHLWHVEAEQGRQLPKIPGWRDGIDVVVIDCPAFPCHQGLPFDCPDPYHFANPLDHRAPSQDCSCHFHWSWIFFPQDGPTLPEVELELALLGYGRSGAPREETSERRNDRSGRAGRRDHRLTSEMDSRPDHRDDRHGEDVAELDELGLDLPWKLSTGRSGRHMPSQDRQARPGLAPVQRRPTSCRNMRGSDHGHHPHLR